MTRNEIEDRLAKILEDVVGLNPDDVSEERSLANDFGIESILVFVVTQAVEKEFDIDISREEFDTVGELITCIQAEMK
jgi:acyl carrier protein